MNKNKRIIFSSIISLSILFSYGTSFALDNEDRSNVSQEKMFQGDENDNIISSYELENKNQILIEKDINLNSDRELQSKDIAEENKDLFVFEGAEAFLNDENSTVDIYSHSNSIYENSIIEFRHEDGTILTFKSTNENSRNGNYYFRIKPTKSGRWFLSTFNKKHVKNESLNFIAYRDFDDFNEKHNKDVLNIIAKENNRRRFKRSLRNVTRYSGSNRFNTATSISKNNFSSANNVIIVNGWAPSDALAATALAKQLNAPILYTESTFLESNTRAEISRLNARKAYVVGGISSVSDETYNEIRNTGNISSIERISGSNRADTALALAKKTMQYSKGRSAIVVDGKSEMDCLASSATSGEYANPLIYVVDGKLDSNSRNFIRNNFSKVFTISGDKKISNSIINDLKSFCTVYEKHGNDSYDLSINISNDSMFYSSIDDVYITANTPDGIPGSLLAAKKGVPLILFNSSKKSSIVSYIVKKNINNIFLLGGLNSIPQSFENELNGDGGSNVPGIDSRRQAIVNLAKKQIGKPYVWSATGPSSFDCSGLVLYVYKNAVGITPPRTSRQQSNYGKYVSQNDLLPGDLIFWGKPVSHVGIYIGDGNVVHAADERQGVITQKLSVMNKYQVYNTSRRFLN